MTEKMLSKIIRKLKSKAPNNRRRILNRILEDVKKNNFRNKNHLIKIIIDEMNCI